MSRPLKRAVNAFLNDGLDLSALTASSTELNILDGATVTTAEVNILHGVTATAADLNFVSTVAAATAIGAPAGTGVACAIKRAGNFFSLDFTLTNVAITHTDAAGSGSSGSLKIFDFAEGMVTILGARMNLSFLGDALIDTNAGDMAFVCGLGSVAADAGNGALTGTEVNICTVSSTVTLSAKAGSLASFPSVAVLTPIDGTATAVDLYFNESGTAATSDANGVLTVTGTITVNGMFLGDD